MLAQFNSQWQKFVEEMDKVERNFGTAYNSLQALTTTRRRMLEKPLDKITELAAHDGKNDDKITPLPPAQNS